MQHTNTIVGITQGDPNGIGYETILKALSDIRLAELYTVVIYGNRASMEFYRKSIKTKEKIFINYIDTLEKASPKKINFLSIAPDYTPTPGVIDPEAGKNAITALEKATEDASSGKINVLVTSPIDKHNTPEGFDFVGHTEYLAKAGGVENPLMFMVSENLRVGLVTMHIALEQVPQQITAESVIEHITLMKNSLEKDFMIRAPRIGVLSINPHTGENGMMGTQEQQTLIPALKKAQEMSMGAYGPFAADGYFGSGSYAKFDATLAMYHDQGLAPFKTLSFEGGVNFTAGLPFVRTSPAHGTGFDIAGQWIASEGSLRSAIYTGADIFRNRIRFEQMSANPLKSSARHNYKNSHHKDANVEDLLPMIND